MYCPMCLAEIGAPMPGRRCPRCGYSGSERLSEREVLRLHQAREFAQIVQEHPEALREYQRLLPDLGRGVTLAEKLCLYQSLVQASGSTDLQRRLAENIALLRDPPDFEGFD